MPKNLYYAILQFDYLTSENALTVYKCKLVISKLDKFFSSFSFVQRSVQTFYFETAFTLKLRGLRLNLDKTNN